MTNPLGASSYADRRDFLRDRAPAIEGAPRNAAGAVEQIRLCAALLEAQGPSTRAFFGGFP